LDRPVRRWRAIGMLLTARLPEGTMSVVVQGILNSGSSQPGERFARLGVLGLREEVPVTAVTTR